MAIRQIVEHGNIGYAASLEARSSKKLSSGLDIKVETSARKIKSRLLFPTDQPKKQVILNFFFLSPINYSNKRKVKTIIMKATLFLLSGILGLAVMADPIPENQPAGALATYKITCSGGLEPDRRCKNGKKKDGCRCDAKGAYLCDPASLRTGQCAKCGCQKA